jgi:hypothetical protein
MSYVKERDEAAKTATFKPHINNPDILYGIEDATPRTAWKAGADWALTSKAVKELYLTSLNMHSCVNADPCESEIKEVEALGKALEAFAKALKEIEK